MTSSSHQPVALPWPHVHTHTCHTLVLGSGAAGLNAAVQLRRSGVEDVLVVSEGLDQGTSINTGSDKQTYYKLGLCGNVPDSPRELAETLFAGGAMHGDLALTEAACSARAFLNLVNLGVPFPRDAYGQFVGYKTDHDPRQRATSVGPYTSRDMCRALIAEVQRLKIEVREGLTAVSLLAVQEDGARCAGALFLNSKNDIEVVIAENTVFAVGGPAGTYRHSVYPACHTGGIGLALEIGACAQNLPESQHGLASLKHRWNVSGSYMQVIPRFVSIAADGVSDPQEFLRPWFASTEEMCDRIFLKGYQWPFDARKVAGGSSLIDLLVHRETLVLGRRVFLDYRQEPTDIDWHRLSRETTDYLRNSEATGGTPLTRLQALNPGAIQLYRDHGIDLAQEPLEIAVCAQHNNGGLAANTWWESANVSHLFPIGEVNGSHGVYRPGGAALNAGQVGGLRAAEFIAARYRGHTLDTNAAQAAAAAKLKELAAWLARGEDARDWREERAELQARMSLAGAQLRDAAAVRQAVQEARAQCGRIEEHGCAGEPMETLRTRSLCRTHRVYLEAIAFAIEAGVGSRGSALVLAPDGAPVHPQLPATWQVVTENEVFRAQVQETSLRPDGTTANRFVPRRPIPETDTWFETAWRAFRDDMIYDPR
jgi:succinate dehydrogenase/fumarate reductase flavoprotein subunit